MTKPFNRIPRQLSEPRDDGRTENFNLLSFKGIINSENDLTVHPNSFVDSDNMYINSNETLSSRPALKSTALLENDLVLDNAKQVWVIDDLLVYHVGTKLRFIKHNVLSDVQIEVGETVNVLDTIEKYIIVYPANIYIDITARDDQDNLLYTTAPISDISYIPTTELRSGNSITYPEKANVISPYVKHSVIYNESVYTDLSDLYGNDVDILIGGKTYTIENFSDMSIKLAQDVFTIADFDYIKYSRVGSAIGFKNNLFYYAADGKNFVELPVPPISTVNNVIDIDPGNYNERWRASRSSSGNVNSIYKNNVQFVGEGYISQEGDCIILVHDDGIYAYSLTETLWDSTNNMPIKKWNVWTKLPWNSLYTKEDSQGAYSNISLSDVFEEGIGRLNIKNMCTPMKSKGFGQNQAKVINDHEFYICMMTGCLSRPYETLKIWEGIHGYSNYTDYLEPSPLMAVTVFIYNETYISNIKIIQRELEYPSNTFYQVVDNYFTGDPTYDVNVVPAVFYNIYQIHGFDCIIVNNEIHIVYRCRNSIGDLRPVFISEHDELYNSFTYTYQSTSYTYKGIPYWDLSISYDSHYKEKLYYTRVYYDPSHQESAVTIPTYKVETTVNTNIEDEMDYIDWAGINTGTYDGIQTLYKYAELKIANISINDTVLTISVKTLAQTTQISALDRIYYLIEGHTYNIIYDSSDDTTIELVTGVFSLSEQMLPSFSLKFDDGNMTYSTNTSIVSKYEDGFLAKTDNYLKPTGDIIHISNDAAGPREVSLNGYIPLSYTNYADLISREFNMIELNVADYDSSIDPGYYDPAKEDYINKLNMSEMRYYTYYSTSIENQYMLAYNPYKFVGAQYLRVSDTTRNPDFHYDNLGIVLGKTSRFINKSGKMINIGASNIKSDYYYATVSAQQYVVYVLRVRFMVSLDKIYTNKNLTATLSQTLQRNFTVPNITHSSKLIDHFLSEDKNLYIGKTLYDENDNLKVYFPESLTEQFDEKVFQLQPLSRDTMGVYCRDSVWLVYEQDGAYYKSRSKIAMSCREGDSIIFSINGKGSVYPCNRGLAYIEHQSLLSVQEPQLSFISDNIEDMILEWLKNNSVRMYVYQFWLFVYSNTSNVIFLMDMRDNTWWKWTTPYNIQNIFVYMNELYVLTHNKICKFTEDGEYYDMIDMSLDIGWDKKEITWYLESQRLYLSDVNRYKHIYGMVINTRVNDGEYEDVSMRLNCYIYRTAISKTPDEVLDYRVIGRRSYFKKINVFKCNFFKFRLSSDTQNDIEGSNYKQSQKKIEGITIKYGTRERIR